MNSAFHPDAREEFLAAIAFYNNSVPGLGAEFAAEIEAAVDRVEAFPRMWPEVSFEIHRCLVQRFPYALLYAIENGTVVKPSATQRKLEPDPFLSKVEVRGSLFDDDSADWEAMNG